MLYTKNGSIPKPETDGTEGWLEVPDAPIPGEGQEVIWCYPPGWVVRDVMPPEREGYCWMHFLDQGWVEYQLPQNSLPVEPLPAITSSDIIAIDSQQISAL